MSMPTLWTLSKKELKSYLDSPLSFLVAVPFLLISFFLYFRTAFIFGQATLRPYFDLLPWFLIILAPALTMLSFTEERSHKTLELLLAHPISELKIVVSKFGGAFLFYLLILGSSLTLTAPLILFSKPDFGLIGSQYLGGALVGGLFLSLGILASSLVESSVASFLLAAAGSFGLLLLGTDLVTLTLPPPFGNLANYLSPVTHQATIARGLLDPADVFYFLTLTLLFLLGAVYKISETKISEIKSEKRKLRISLGLVLILGVLSNLLFLNVPLRLDLTSGKLYSLSQATRNLATKIDDLLTVKLYASEDLPPTAQTTLKQIQDFLEDLKRLNKNIKVEKLNPQAQNAEAQKAISEGLAPVQFNTVGSSSYQIQQGFLGLSFRYGQKIEALPFVSETQSLEGKTAQILKNLLNVRRHDVSFFPGGEGRQRFSKFIEVLGKSSNLKEVELDQNFASLKPELLIILGPNEPLKPEAVEKVKTFLAAGGKVLFFLDKVAASPNSFQATPLTTGLESLLQDYGLKTNSDLVYDLNLAETIQVSQGSVSYLLPYPFWLKALPADLKFPPTAQLTNLTLFWPSSLELKSSDGWQVSPLFKTSRGGGVLTGAAMTIAPAQLNQINFAPGKEIIVAATVTAAGNPKESPRLTVIADADFISDSYLGTQSPSLAFGVNLVDFLSSNREEIVPLRTGVENLFVFKTSWQPVVVQYGVTLGTAACVGFLAGLRLWRRRRGYNRIYDRLIKIQGHGPSTVSSGSRTVSEIES